MKSTVGTIVVAAVGGLMLGVVIAIVQARPWKVSVDATGAARSSGKTAAGDTGNASDAGTKSAVVQLDETTFEFGTMARGTTMSHAFTVRNIGGSPLHIEVGSTTCKCTVGDLSTNDIAPQAEAEVRLEWTAKTMPGPFRHGATLLTNDPHQSRVELVVEGLVVESTATMPGELHFGTIGAGETKQAELYLMAFLQDDVQIFSQKVLGAEEAGQIDIQVEPCEPSELPNADARAGLKIVASMHAGHTLGPVQASLSLETNLEKAKKLEIPILANVIGDISIFGPGWIARRGLLKLGTIRSEQGKQVRLNIAIHGKDAGNTQLEIVSVEPTELRASLGKPHTMGKHLVHVPLLVEVPTGTRTMARRGADFGEAAQIVISTTHPKTPQLKLQVEFAVVR